jgi:hypothetical protein
MTQRALERLLAREKVVVAINPPAYVTLLSTALSLLHRGVYPVARIEKGWKSSGPVRKPDIEAFQHASRL